MQRFINNFYGLESKEGPIQQLKLVMTRPKLLALHQKEYFDTARDLLSLSPFHDD